MTKTRWREKARELAPGARFDEPMIAHTTFKIGGPADCYAEVLSRAQLRGLLALAKEEGQGVLFLGWGSNILVRDGGIRGLVLRLRGDFEKVSFEEGFRVRAGCGVRVPQLVSLCAEKGLSGDESLVGIPGTVGGALVMNAGTRDGEIGDLVVEVDCVDPATLQERRISHEEARFSYRSSALAGSAVLGCLLQLKPGDKVDIMKLVAQYQQRRLQTQPVHTYNVGSTFKNPPGRFAARLIEEEGLKGEVFGGARVSPAHANFIENFAGAKASDVLELVRRVQERVKASRGLDLELEMKVVGEA
jgi:UDP-N-acetylmuramate dehydrogenase